MEDIQQVLKLPDIAGDEDELMEGWDAVNE
jgi:hypothetical protein